MTTESTESTESTGSTESAESAVSAAPAAPTGRLHRLLHDELAAYRHGEDRPLAGYVALMSVYTLATGAVVALARLTGRRIPRGFSPWDVAQLAIATHRISRTLAKDPVTSPLRVPFTRYEGLAESAELSESVRGDGMRHAVGELLTCPMCLSQWVATGLCAGLVLAPRPTRAVLATSCAVAGADALQYGYARLQQSID